MSTWNEIKNSLDKLLVGGAVRDFIMDVKPKDNDWLVTNKTEACMLGLGFERVGKSISTPVFFHSLDPMREDYALPRKETSTGVTTEDFSFDTTNITIEEDLFRRDFTINAIAMYSNEGLFDPFDGYSDIQAKEIRHLDDNAFMEDPLRIFRAARFAAQLSFKIIPDTVALCRKMVSSGLHRKVSADRVREETKKALSCKYPSLYFNALRDFGALEYWFSPIYKMIGIPQPKGHHGEGDVYNHTMMVLEEVRKRTDDVPTLFAALLHDVGKINSPAKSLPAHHKHEAYGDEHITQMCNKMKAEKRWRSLSKLMAKWHMHFHKVFDLTPGKIRKIFDALKVSSYSDDVVAWCIIGESDEMGRMPGSDLDYVNKKTCYIMEAALAYRSVKANPDVSDIKSDIIQRRVLAIKEVKKRYVSHI